MSRRILIIDDEEHIRRVITITLEAAGYVVGQASDGNHGLGLFLDGSTWDCVILDQRMPGLDGLEVLRQIKKVNPRAKVIMATAYASIEIAVAAMKLGASDFVRKPMTPDMLRNAVAAALTRRPDIIEQPATDSESKLRPIETITMNGFTILDVERATSGNKNERIFNVIRPDGKPSEVIVGVAQSVIDYVARLAQRHLSAESSFWTEEARRLLGDYLWFHGDLPQEKLTLKEIDRDKIVIAQRWND